MPELLRKGETVYSLDPRDNHRVPLRVLDPYVVHISGICAKVETPTGTTMYRRLTWLTREPSQETRTEGSDST